jgi:endonuclease YncB( thermonuclease family)
MFTKKGATWRLFLCLLYSLACLFSPATSLAGTECSSDFYDEQASIRYIHDGDTLHLSDGRKIRLIGINTPELARDDRAAEPFALQAKNALQALFKTDRSISLLFGKDKKDRYGRLLAHAFLNQGENVQASLLKQGYASAISVPPNTRFARCYLKMEKIARCNKAGLWQNTSIIQAKDLNSQDIGFRLVQGVIKTIDVNDTGIWLNLEDKLTVGIRPENHSLFDIESIKAMLNQSIIVRGWLNTSKYENPFYLRVRHPLSIHLSSKFSCS